MNKHALRATLLALALALVGGLGLAAPASAVPIGRPVMKLSADGGSAGNIGIGRFNGLTTQVAPGINMVTTGTWPRDSWAYQSVKTGRGWCISERGWYQDDTSYSARAYGPIIHRYTTANGGYRTLEAVNLAKYDTVYGPSHTNTTTILNLYRC